MNTANVYRDMLINLATPAEEKYLDFFRDSEAIPRAWLALGMHVTAHADLIFRFESLHIEHRKLTATHAKCEKTFADDRNVLSDIRVELTKVKDEHAECANKDPEEMQKLKSEHACLVGRVSDLEKEKEEWRQVSADQADTIKTLEAELGKAKLALSDEEKEYQKLLQEKQEISIAAGNAGIDRNKVVNEFLSEMVCRFLGSHEFKTALAEPFNLYY